MRTKKMSASIDPKYIDHFAITPSNIVSNLQTKQIHTGLNGKTKIRSDVAEVLFLTSYPPRECGIATYSQDLIRALNKMFNNSFNIRVCALESDATEFNYPNEVKFRLQTTKDSDYEKLALKINADKNIEIVLIEHEFGFFETQQQAFLLFLYEISKPIVIVFHTVLPHPTKLRMKTVQTIVAACQSVVVMTNNASQLLVEEYNIPKEKIVTIAHGTHLVLHMNKDALKTKYGFQEKKILTTFGLLSSGKSIETAINALPEIVAKCPYVLFLILGKTHPEVKKREGEQYRQKLELMVENLSLKNHVKFINAYLNLSELLDYLQLTDIYLFTTNDPNQAVSGTFAYAMSCACPIISTPIPHAKEVLTENTGIIFDFDNSSQLAQNAILLLNNEEMRNNMSINSLGKIMSSAWENSAVLHALLFESLVNHRISLKYNLPEISLNHLNRMTTNIGIIQFSKLNQPDLESGYTLDDNARALILMCMHLQLYRDKKDLPLIYKYLQFIKFCLQPNGSFLNYVDKNNAFTIENSANNLEDSNGRAIWALGYLISLENLLPIEIINSAEEIMDKSMMRFLNIHSTRAIAFAIKGLYFYRKVRKDAQSKELFEKLSMRLVNMYNHHSTQNWHWFEEYLTYANSILPEAMLYAYLVTGKKTFKEIAVSSLDFLSTIIFHNNEIKVISNRIWLQKDKEIDDFGEQPIDVAYTILTLSQFYDALGEDHYFQKMNIAFNWFLGKNRLHQIIYNPCTGGCYDGLEENNVNLNQGAESTLCYLMARLALENYKKTSFTS